MCLQERKVVKNKENELEEWKRRERVRVEEEVERARRPLVEQLELLQKEKSRTEETLQEQQGMYIQYECCVWWYGGMGWVGMESLSFCEFLYICSYVRNCACSMHLSSPT